MTNHPPSVLCHCWLGSVPIRRNANLTLTLNPNFDESGFGESGRHRCLGHQTCKNRRPYNLYCVGADLKPCSINQSINPTYVIRVPQSHGRTDEQLAVAIPRSA